MAAGGAYTVAVTAGGRLYAWGYGGHGWDMAAQVAIGWCRRWWARGVRSAVVMAACGAFHTLVVTRDGLWACGSGEFGRLGLNDERQALVERVAAGALAARGSCRGWPLTGSGDGARRALDLGRRRFRAAGPRF